MSNNINVQNLVAAEALRVLTNELVFTNKINRAYEDKFDLEVQDHRIGTSLRIPKPARFGVRSGWVRQAQNVAESFVTLNIDTPKGVDCDFTDSDLALLTPDPDKNMPAWSKRFLRPRIIELANMIDLDVFARSYVTVPHSVGTPGSTPSTFDVIGDAMQKLDESVAPPDDRIFIGDPGSRNKLAAGLKGVFTQQVAEKALLRGYITSLADFEMFMSQSVPSQTTGAFGGTPLVNGGSQVGSTLVTNGWSNSITGLLNSGDIFTIAGVYQVNPVNKQTLSALQQFVVTATANSDGSGNSTVSIYPSIITSGATQTVNASPAANAAITVLGNASSIYPQNLAFHPDAFTVAFAKLYMPKMTVECSQQSYDGFAMRYMRGFDINNAQLVDRLDVYYGTCPLYQDWACRISG